MSVATHSPVCGSKRLLQDTDPCEHLGSYKRSKLLDWPGAYQHYGGGYELPTVFEAFSLLKDRFPNMDEKVITEVLQTHPNDLEAALQRLTQLQLDQDQAADLASHGQDIFPDIEQLAQKIVDGQQQQQGNSQQQTSPSSGSPRLPQNAQEWVEAVVSEMEAAINKTDAQQRAAKVLQAFENATLQRTGQQDQRQQQHKLEAALKENALLKRAVAIQNSKIKEVGGKDAQLESLRQLLDQQQEKIKHLEMNNYSLAMHLKHATANTHQAERNPDVY